MSVWRRKALALFPELKETIQKASIYQLFFDLLPAVQQAHARRDEKRLRRIHGFAEWCLHQRAKDTWNAAAVCFYEHLFDDRKHFDAVIPWLSPAVIENCKPLWESMRPNDFADIVRALSRRKTARYRETVFATGAIQKL